jgi:hypothetical protein
MGESDDIYWQRWQKLLEAAANFQELLTGSVMIGGSAAAVHLKHRYSFEIDLSQYKGIQIKPFIEINLNNLSQLPMTDPGIDDYRGPTPGLMVFPSVTQPRSSREISSPGR